MTEIVILTGIDRERLRKGLEELHKHPYSAELTTDAYPEIGWAAEAYLQILDAEPV